MKQPLTGSFELIKNLNTSCILNTIRENNGISRAEIARLTGLTPATVSNITAELIGLNIVAETERGESSGGRKPVMLSICKDAYTFAGVHIASDVIETAVMDMEANILSRRSEPLEQGIDAAAAISKAADMLRLVMSISGRVISGIGVSVHGLVDSKNGVSVFAPNLGWENVPIAEILSADFSLPVIVENDVRAMTLAESWCGIARNISDYVYLYIGPGVGGSIVIDDEVYKGHDGFAGEFGHSTIDPEGPLCPCGNRGCLQALASEVTVLKNYSSRKSSFNPGLTFEDVLNAADSGDVHAQDEISKSIRYIGIEVGNIINAFNPPLIVLGGRLLGYQGAMPELISEAKRRAMKYAQNNTRIVYSTLGTDASLRGAGTCIIRRMFFSPISFLRRV